MRSFKSGILLTLLLARSAATGSAAELPRVSPEEAGIDRAQLERGKAFVQAMVDKKETAGVVTLVARHGKVVQLDALGLMDIEAAIPMQPDTIFRIYSMTKPITTVAAMLLWEEGRFQLDDPAAKYLPELKGLRVHAAKGDETVAAQREMTIRDLMRHTSGLTYGAFGNTPVDQLYKEMQVLNPDSSLSEMVKKLGKLPLMYQPGTRFHYSVSTDVLGRLVEVISGKPLDEFFQDRIFRPLDMKDTGFFVPEDKLSRLAANYGPGEMRGLKVIDAPAQSRYRTRPKLLSGGGGLVSTARDYLHFCQMLIQGGELQGTRLLRPETVQQMTTNKLPEEALPLRILDINMPGVGFGLGFSVRMADVNPVLGVPGEYGWGGAASTHFWIAPKQELVVILLQQYMPFTPRLESALKPILYKALKN